MKRRGKYLFLGLSNAGKTSLIKYLLEEGNIDPFYDLHVQNEFAFNTTNGKFLC